MELFWLILQLYNFAKHAPLWLIVRMKNPRNLIRCLGMSLLLGSFSPIAFGASHGTWLSPVNGNWTDSARWVGGAIADGEGRTADFSNSTGTTVNVNLSGLVSLGFLKNNETGSTGGLNISGPGELYFGIGTGAATPTLTVRSTTIGVTISGDEGLIIAAQKSTAALGLTLSGSNTYTGKTTIQSGVVTLAHNNALGAGGSEANGTSVGISGGAYSGAIALRDGVTIANEVLRLGKSGEDGALGALYVADANATATWGGKIYLDAQAPRISGGSSTGSTLIIAGEIAKGTVNDLQITGQGTVLLTGSASYTGLTTIYRGTLKLGGDNRLATTSKLAIGSTGDMAVFDLNGYNQQLDKIDNLSGATIKRIITNSDAAKRSILTVAGDGDSTDMVYKGNLSLVKKGIGNLTVNENSNYSGDTFIEKGTLTLRGLVLADNADVHIETGAKLIFGLGLTSIDTINALFYNGIAQAIGTYGSLTNTNADFRVAFIEGDAMLNVAIPEPGAVSLALGGVAMLAFGWRRRRH